MPALFDSTALFNSLQGRKCSELKELNCWNLEAIILLQYKFISWIYLRPAFMGFSNDSQIPGFIFAVNVDLLLWANIPTAYSKTERLESDSLLNLKHPIDILSIETSNHTDKIKWRSKVNPRSPVASQPLFRTHGLWCKHPLQSKGPTTEIYVVMRRRLAWSDRISCGQASLKAATSKLW